MSNSFFSHTSPFQSGTTVRADGVNAKFDAVEAAFDLAEAKVDKSISIDAAASHGSLVIPNMTITNSFIYFDADGNITLYDKGGFDIEITEAMTSAKSQVIDAATTIQADITEKHGDVAEKHAEVMASSVGILTTQVQENADAAKADAISANNSSLSALTYKNEAEQSAIDAASNAATAALAKTLALAGI